MPKVTQTDGPIVTKQFDMEHLHDALDDMNPRKSGGPDGIEIAFLKKLPMIGKKRLLTLVNRSYAEVQTPARWRMSTLVAIPKPGVRKKILAYLPHSCHRKTRKTYG